jgi:hypothetical protein
VKGTGGRPHRSPPIAATRDNVMLTDAVRADLQVRICIYLSST